MKRRLHRKVDFKTNALNNAHVSHLLHNKAGLLQNDGIIIYLQIKKKLMANGYKAQNNTWPSVLSTCTFHYINQIIQKMLFPSTLLNVNFVKYGPKNVYKNKVI
jgi:hypothetical protein